MERKRPTNSELRLSRLDEEESRRERERGILEIFGDRKPGPDGDAPPARDGDSALEHDPAE